MSAMRAVCLDCTGGRLCPKHRVEREAQVQEDMEAAKAKLAKARELGMVFEEPPPPTRMSPLENRLGSHLDLLMQFPGEWALIARYENPKSAYTTSLSLRKKPLRPGRWEFRHAVTSLGSKLYGRYLGPDDKP